MAEKPSQEEIDRFHRYFAIEANNRAWTLVEKADRSQDENRELLRVAGVSQWHWEAVGTEVHKARASMLMAEVYAQRGYGDAATRAGRTFAANVDGRDAPGWEVAFKHAILAHAASARGDAAEHTAEYAKAEEVAATLGQQDREIFDATFAMVPNPG